MIRAFAVVLALGLAAVTAGPAQAFEPPTPAAPAAATVQHADSVYPSVGAPGLDVRDYGLSLRWQPAARRLVGVARLRLVPAEDGGFRLDLAHRLRVTSLTVRDPASGARLRSTSRHPGRHLAVSVPGAVAGTTYAVRIGYRGTPGPARPPSSRQDVNGLGWHTTRSGQVWTMQEPFGAYTWYPVNDHPSDKATYRVRLDVPRRWVGVSTGRLAARRVTHGRTITRFTNRDPMASYLMTVAIGPYRRSTQTGPHGLPLTYWVPRSHPGYLRALRTTPAALRWLERRLGRYPFDRAGVVVVPAASAMETQTMVTLGAETFGYGDREVRETVLHELAHAWYGDTVTPDDWSDVWMNEGMAMYLEARWVTDQGWRPWSYWERLFNRDDALWRTLYGPPGDYHPGDFAQVNVYFSTARMLIRLRDRLGAEEFDALLRQWPQEHRNTVQDRSSYATWVAARSGEDPTALRSFFNEWLMSPDAPE